MAILENDLASHGAAVLGTYAFEELGEPLTITVETNNTVPKWVYLGAGKCQTPDATWNFIDDDTASSFSMCQQICAGNAQCAAFAYTENGTGNCNMYKGRYTKVAPNTAFVCYTKTQGVCVRRCVPMYMNMYERMYACMDTCHGWLDACMCACVRACMRACVRARARAYVRLFMHAMNTDKLPIALFCTLTVNTDDVIGANVTRQTVDACKVTRNGQACGNSCTTVHVPVCK